MEIKGLRSRQLGQQVSTSTLGHTEYERWAWEVSSPMCATFLLTLPDQLGYMEDALFQVAIMTYLG